jgi:hypothetical protein
MVKQIERVGKTRLAASTSLFGLPSPPSRLGRNLSDCQRQISHNRTSGEPPVHRSQLIQFCPEKIRRHLWCVRLVYSVAWNYRG